MLGEELGTETLYGKMDLWSDRSFVMAHFFSGTQKKMNCRKAHLTSVQRQACLRIAAVMRSTPQPVLLNITLLELYLVTIYQNKLGENIK